MASLHPSHFTSNKRVAYLFGVIELLFVSLMAQLVNGKAVLLALRMLPGPAVLQRDAQRIVRQGRDLPAGMKVIPNRRCPKSLFPPSSFIH